MSLRFGQVNGNDRISVVASCSSWRRCFAGSGKVGFLSKTFAGEVVRPLNKLVEELAEELVDQLADKVSNKLVVEGEPDLHAFSISIGQQLDALHALLITCKV